MSLKRWDRDQSGVSLIELMAVVGIMAIVTAIAVPTYMSYLPFLKIRSAARDLISDLRYTRQQAVSKNKDHRLRFTSDTEYVVERDTGDAWENVKTVNVGSNYANVERTLPEDTASAIVYFVPNGGLDPAHHGAVTEANPFILTLAHSESGEARTIKINRLGRVWTE